MEIKIKNEIIKLFEKNNWIINKFDVSKPINIEFGEYTTNVAMVCAKKNNLAPFELANKLINEFKKEKFDINEIKIMGPGFINFYLNNSYYSNIIKNVIENKKFGQQERKNILINNEYVSANPTGFLHVAHARGAALGDSLSNILEFGGYDVIREYYINDAGNQIDRLAISIYVRYHQEFKVDISLPEDSYSGIDIIWGAKKIIEKYGNKFLNIPYEECKDSIKKISTQIMLEKIKEDLKKIGVEFNVWFSEKSLYEDGLIDKQLKNLKGVYKKEGAIWLSTSNFGDDKDRVLLKSDGSGTYFLSDTIYHTIKANREPKPKLLIDIWGADHIGYIKRVESALELQGFSSNILNVITIQLVKLIKDGKEIKMSKRKGTSLFMSELIEEIGKDTLRFFLVNRSNNSSIDLDLDLANLKTNDNPLFIIQYAYARINQLLIKSNIKNTDLTNLFFDKQEFKLILLINKFPELIEQICQNKKVHLLSQYLIDLAREYNSFYSNSKILGTSRENDLLSLSKACSIVLKKGLNLLGVSAPEKM